MFLALQTPELTARLVRAAARSDPTIILDLEDALWDVTDPARTEELKAAGRRTLVALAAEHPELFQRQSIGVRVNRVSGRDGDLDFAALEQVAASAPIACVMMPKVQGVRGVEAGRDRIRALGLSPSTLIPILETRRALSRLDVILDAASAAGVEWAVFGLYDLALDSRWWPFPDHDGEELWSVCRPFLDRVEAAGIRFIDAPYGKVHDDAGLIRILDRLAASCRREFGVLTVSVRQTVVTGAFATGRAGLGEGRNGVAKGPPIDPLELATRVVALYDDRLRTRISFTLDPVTGRFISPHVYLAARRFLQEQHA
jgi:citrate lyase beta subunit